MAGWRRGPRIRGQGGFAWAGHGALPVSAFDGLPILPRTFFSITALTTACLAAACFAPPALAQGVLRPVEALIVNPANRPVPVTVLSTPAQPGDGSREIYSLTLPSLSFLGDSFVCSQPQAVPTGKRLVVEYVSGWTATEAGVALVYIGIRPSPASGITAFVPAGPALATPFGANFSAAGQPVRTYLDAAFQVCALATSLSTANVQASVVGYLVNKP